MIILLKEISEKRGEMGERVSTPQRDKEIPRDASWQSKARRGGDA